MLGTGTQKQFIGRYYHALEQKGRLSIPATFRASLGHQALLTHGLDGCLFLFDLDTWATLSQKSVALPLTKKTARDWVRLLANSATEVSFDRLGRILIPEYLRESARLRKHVCLVGSLNRIEIWDQENYRLYLQELETSAEAVADSVGEIYDS